MAISDTIEINPLKGEDKAHVGMFYTKNDNEYFAGPLPKNNPEILEMLYDLAQMLSNKVMKI